MALATTLSQTSRQAWICPFRYIVVAVSICENAIMRMLTADMTFCKHHGMSTLTLELKQKVMPKLSHPYICSM